MKGKKVLENKNVVAMPSAKEINETAALWVMRLDDSELDAVQHAQLTKWLSESDHHAAAFDRLATLWGVLDSMKVLADFKVASERADSTRLVRQPNWWMAIAASFLFAVISIAAWRGDFLSPDAQLLTKQAEVYTTGAGEIRTIALADGTLIKMNTSSVMEVSYSDEARMTYLRSGEAHFDVTKDALRPFSVRTNRGQVNAVGTAFSVRLMGNELDVIVSEGIVSLQPKSELGGDANTGDYVVPALVMVSAGENAVYDGATSVIKAVSRDAIENKLSWRSGMLIFSGEPLGDVLREVGRYTNLVIEIEDRGLADLPVSGRLKIGEVDAMLEALEIMAGTKVHRITPGRVVLQKNG